jgi:SPP1 gp7 family putative phage head morphogenesis protein
MAARRRRRKRRIPSRAARLSGSPKPPRAAELFYVLAVKRLAERWAKAAKKRALAVAASIARPDTRSDASPDDLEGLSRLGKSLAGAASFKSSLGGVADKATRHNKAEFKRIGIKIREAEPDLDPLITTWRKSNVALVTKLLAREAKKLARVLAESEGSRHEVIAKRIEERLDVTTRKAILIARDQTLTLNAQINQERQRSAGIEEGIWTTVGDERVRESHEAMDGVRYRFDDPPEVDGEKVLPGEPVNCRCQQYPVIPELE